jgi:hypothetical protein
VTGTVVRVPCGPAPRRSGGAVTIVRVISGSVFTAGV